MAELGASVASGASVACRPTELHNDTGDGMNCRVPHTNKTSIRCWLASPQVLFCYAPFIITFHILSSSAGKD